MNNKYLNYAIFLAIIIVVVLSVVVSLRKGFLDWDTLALYDARAKFLSSGFNFSQMKDFGIYDNLNQYYYTLYPPFTSTIHLFWYKLIPGLTTGFFYSVCLILLGVAVYLTTEKILGRTLALLMVFWSVANKDTFVVSTMQYTNIPYALYLVLGIFLILNYLKYESRHYLYWASIFIAASVWIRFLEPIWIVVVAAFLVTTLIRKRFLKSIPEILILAIPSIMAYEAWSYFAKTISGNPSTVLIDLQHIVEPLLGIFTGSAVSIFSYFVSWFGIQLMMSGAVIFIVFYGKKLSVIKPENIYLIMVIIGSIFIYFAGLYFVSFQASWWVVLGDSLERSSIILIPIIAFLSLDYIKDLLKSRKLL